MVVTKTKNTLSNKIFKYKEKTIKEEGGIYEINCKNCKSTYVGKSCRNFKTRLKEHENVIINQEVTKSAVASHMFEKGHLINHKKSGLIKKVGNKKKLYAMKS